MSKEDKKFKLSGVGPSTYFDIRTAYLAYVEQCNKAGFDTRPCKAWYELEYKAEFPKFGKEYDFSIMGLMKGPDTKNKLVNDSDIEARVKQDLAYMGVTTEMRKDAYNHWLRFALYACLNTGIRWEKARMRLRSFIGVGYNFIDEYKGTSIEWGIIRIDNDILTYVGRPTETKGEE
jgi:hypothetical protein